MLIPLIVACALFMENLDSSVVATSLPQIAGGKVRPIGMAAKVRSTYLPNLPTLAEQGLKDDAYRIVGFVGLGGPAKLPPALIERISTEVQAVMALPEVRERIVSMGFTPVGGTPAQFAAVYKRDAPIWEKLVRQSGAKAD